MSWRLEIEHPLGPMLQIRQHRLDNGLVLVHVADSSAPIVSYQTWFRVGSRHERPGKTGIAHLFEHLMFSQTSSREAGEFDRIIEELGGDTNAATWVDWTYYRCSVPSRGIEKVVELEAERMIDLLVEPEQLESEREVVINERQQNVDDSVDGLIGEELLRLAFTRHPYHWPTIGWADDIRAITLEDARSFYRTYYSPNNAALVIVGDVDEQRILDLVEQHYGDFEAAEIPTEQIEPEPEQTGERRTELRKPSTERVLWGYKAPAVGDPDWPVLSFLCAMLAGSPSSLLYRRLVIEQEIASSISCDVLPFRDPSLLEISVTVTRDSSSAAAEQELDRCIDQLCSGGISDAEVAKVANLVETAFWTDLQSGDGKAEALGHFHTTLGDFRELFRTADRLARVTAADLERVANEYLVSDHRTTVLVTPEATR